MWHYALTEGQTEQIEAIQKKAIHIMGMPYMSMLTEANLTTLVSHREEISRRFFFIFLKKNFACITFSQIPCHFYT